ncbi:pyridoxamine 5'-phosphate oxidase family protein [Pseudaminobacter sp. NGMCC 1.201702]|uniref:pyridoxamine 5'-phosphate oxidase family protein n=1 Tax=Pseudaminobacter sp. NGMCC 1.201702 TaxID=3391825 RepID=UPI0039EE7B07
MRIRSLSTLECTNVLNANRLGCLGCAKDGHPYVVPFYFAHHDNHLYAFSMVGKKIGWMRLNPQVSVLVEEHVQGREWKSVIVDGRYEELSDRIGQKRERDHAWLLLSRHFDWWEPGALRTVMPPLSDHSDHVFFRIWIEQLSGREIKEDE